MMLDLRFRLDKIVMKKKKLCFRIYIVDDYSRKRRFRYIPMEKFHEFFQPEQTERSEWSLMYASSMTNHPELRFKPTMKTGFEEYLTELFLRKGEKDLYKLRK